MKCVRILLILCVFMLVISCTPKEETIKLNASVQYDSQTIYLTNNDTFDWIDVDLGINGFDYTYSLNMVRSGKSRDIPIREFVNDQGDRFNALSKKIMTLYIVSEVPKGACALESN